MGGLVGASDAPLQHMPDGMHLRCRPQPKAAEVGPERDVAFHQLLSEDRGHTFRFVEGPKDENKGSECQRGFNIENRCLKV